MRRTQLEEAGLLPQVEWMLGDATQMLKTLDGPFDFVLVDLWKNLYVPCLELFYRQTRTRRRDRGGQHAVSRNGARRCRSLSARCRGRANLQSVLLPMRQRD